MECRPLVDGYLTPTAFSVAKLRFSNFSNFKLTNSDISFTSRLHLTPLFAEMMKLWALFSN